MCDPTAGFDFCLCSRQGLGHDDFPSCFARHFVCHQLDVGTARALDAMSSVLMILCVRVCRFISSAAVVQPGQVA